jgi:hypothetical protein
VVQTLTVFKLKHQRHAISALAAVSFERPVVRPQLPRRPALRASAR